MKNVKIALPNPPEDGINVSKWVASSLRQAFALQLTPMPVPEATLVRRTVSLPDDVASLLLAKSMSAAQSPAIYTAGLVRAMQENRPIQEEEYTSLIGEEMVRPILQPLLRETWAGLQQGKIVFAEASTGTGKGRFIASLGLSAAAAGKTVVISAPLNVSRQLVAEIDRLSPMARPILMLGRSNFVDPYKIGLWLSEASEECSPLHDWLEQGGLPVSTDTQELSTMLGSQLAWLLEDAIALAPDDAPHSSWLLDDDADPANPAEVCYQAIKATARDAQSIIICSHIFLAADCRSRQINPDSATLPAEIDLLLVDEAHNLETAFASIYSQSLHLSTLGHAIKQAGLPAKLANSLLRLNDRLQQAILAYGEALPITGKLEDLRSLESFAVELKEGLDSLPQPKSLEKKAALRPLRYAKQALEDMLSGKSTIQINVSPIRHYPHLTVGRANLEFAFTALWKRIHAAVLVSATLYIPSGVDQYSAAHMRWVLSTPKGRAMYTQPVTPNWVTDTPLLHMLDSPLAPPGLNENPAPWTAQVGQQALGIYQQAKGGMLILCTSYLTAEMLANELLDSLPPDIVIVQSPNCNASACARAFMALHTSGKRPLWIGVGTAWTGVDLVDRTVANGADDFALTDLFITRLPFGTNRSLTHHRRMISMGKSAGMMVEAHETLRMFKQGIGRLVRREGCTHRQLWIGDARLNEVPAKPLYRGFIKLLAKYRRNGT